MLSKTLLVIGTNLEIGSFRTILLGDIFPYFPWLVDIFYAPQGYNDNTSMSLCQNLQGLGHATGANIPSLMVPILLNTP
jgi:hypothetical protein